ncbi:MAG: hypothetical protein KKE50_00545 [Nanoarchaeota archaeon]|nr:hypothetical protein [Nanoarchaeota archaeon]
MAKQKQMTLESITTVRFPHSIIAEEVSELMKYISSKSGCNARYTEEVVHVIEAGGRVSEMNEVTSIRGYISAINLGVPIMPFSLERKLYDEGSRYSGLRFQTSPGYELQELPPQETSLMDTIRIVIGNYFTRCQTQPNSEYTQSEK